MGIDKSSSEWLFFKRHPSWSLRKGRRQIDWIRDLIITEDNAYPGFSKELRILALDVLRVMNKVADLRKALCILSVVGIEEDIPLIEGLYERGDEDLSIDVRTCVYEIRHA